MRAFLLKIRHYWMSYVVLPLGWVNSRIIITVLYIVLIGPYALVHALTKKRQNNLGSYWEKKPTYEPTLENLERLF